MSRGRRYDAEPKLNKKKVFAVIIAFIVIIMFIFVIKGIFSKEDKKVKISSKSYFAAFQDNKWGVINSNGDIVIDPSYQEMLIIPNEKIDVFLCTYDVNYETGDYKTKALNSKNEEIFTEYDQVEAIANQDEANNLWYEENVLRVKKGEKYGMISLDGKQILPNEYEEIVAVSGVKNAFRIKKDGKYGICDNTGKIILIPAYTEITNLGEDNKSGYIVRAENGKYGIMDYSANQVLETKYDEISRAYGNDMYFVVEGGKKELITKDGTVKLSEGFDEIRSILKTQDAGVIYVKDGKFGVMDLTGKVIIPAEYESLKEAKTENLIAKKGGKTGIIDMSQVEKVPFQYTDIVYYSKADIYVAEDENFQTNIVNTNFETKLTGILTELNEDKGYIQIRIGEESRYYNFKFEQKKDTEILTSNTLYVSKKDGKYGFVDKEGKVLVDYQYDDATEQNAYGFAGIKKDGKWGSIDSNGKIIQEPIYNLDNYLLVDFIGNWHLGLDLNMNYYNKE